MSLRKIGRGGLMACAIAFLGWLAWLAISGGVRQLSRSRTFGQKVETVTQVESGVLGLLVAATCFWQRRWAAPIRAAWGVSLAAAAGLSSLVWGPPMPLIGALFVVISLILARTVRWALDTGGAA